ncbi:phosphatase PAP2 family protein [Vallitalea okinawensis]|uniref:phosphatase PAP2 family protein n=1 Tax=Vallitalea okinawensis TaxID=2078660 RepID=UPI000CFD011D|nr:phosphatase PAP2 family protein [Vallitalea okinawensis]
MGILEWVYQLDISIIEGFKTFNAPLLLDYFMAFISTIGNAGLIWIVVSITLLLFKKTRGIGIAAIIALILNTVLVNLFLKPIFNRPRPYAIIEGIEYIIKTPSEPYSFPSGHASSSFAVATAIYLTSFKNKFAYLALILAALIAFARVYFCVHFPSDVIIGSLIGILMGYIGYRSYLKLDKSFIKDKIV